MRWLIKYFRKNFYLIVVGILGLIPLIWFWNKGNFLIDGVDTNFPLNPLVWFARRLYVWNGTLNAGSDFSSSTSGLFFHLIQVIPYLVGFKLQAVELISMLFWFLMTVFSSFFLSRVILPRRFIPQLMFTVFYSFNVYLFNTWENVKVANLSLMVGIPLVLGVLILLDQKKISKVLGFFLACLAGIFLSGTGINPSYFLSLFLVILIYFVGVFIASPGERLTKLGNFITVSLAVILVSSFWLLPTLNFVISGVPTGGSIERIGFTNWIDSLSENTSIFNVLRLQGAWDWYSTDQTTGLPLYIPYALNYFHRLPFIVFSLVAPILAVLSLIFRNKHNRYLYLVFSIMLLVGVFLCSGTHPPTGVVFGYLLNHLPFFSLFRSPWYIFAPLLIISYAGLFGLLFDNAYEYLELKRKRLGNFVLDFLGMILIIGNLIYCYPLVSGKIFRPGRSDSFYVNFPQYVFDASSWLKNEGGEGRIIDYPDDEIQNYQWGYRGIESILQLFANRETISSSLNASDSPIGRLLKEFYLKIKKGELNSAVKIAEKLNVSMVFEKKDQVSLSPSLPEEMVKNYQADSFGEWVFYRLPGGDKFQKVFFSSGLSFLYPYASGQLAMPVLVGGGEMADPNDSEVKGIPKVFDIASKVVIAENLQKESFQEFSNSVSKLSNRLVSRNFSKVEFEITIPEEGLYQPILEKYHLEDFGIGSKGSVAALIDGRAIILEYEKSTDSHIYYQKIFFTKGVYRLEFSLIDKNLVEGGDFESGESFTQGGYGEGRVEYGIKSEGTNHYLSITNYGRAEASANFRVSDFDPFIPYYVEVGYRQIYGNNGLVIPEQNTPTTLVKAQNERLPNYPEWGNFGFYYDPVKTLSEMKVFLVSPFTTDPLGTKIFYDNLVVHKVFTNNLIFVKEGRKAFTTPEISFKKISPVFYQGLVDRAIGPHLLVFSENYSPGWKITLFDEKGKAIRTQPKHFSVNLYANAWFLDKMPENYTFKIYYKPQTLYNLGFFVSSLTILASLGWFLLRKYQHQIK